MSATCQTIWDKKMLHQSPDTSQHLIKENTDEQSLSEAVPVSTNVSTSITVRSPIKEDESMLHIPVHKVNPHLICGLCQGYLYEACTITECMHSFCKSCLVKHLLRSLNCPMCAILIHPTDPFVHIRMDGLLQDIVYALLPQVEKAELENERLFYEKNPGYRREPRHKSNVPAIPKPPSSGVQQPSSEVAPSYPQKLHKSLVALNLQCLESNNKSHTLEKAYVRVTGGTTIRILTSFLKKKLQIQDLHQVDMYCPHRTGLVCLNNAHTLEAVKDLYFYNEDIVRLNYEVRGP